VSHQNSDNPNKNTWVQRSHFRTYANCEQRWISVHPKLRLFFVIHGTPGTHMYTHMCRCVCVYTCRYRFPCFLLHVHTVVPVLHLAAEVSTLTGCECVSGGGGGVKSVFWVSWSGAMEDRPGCESRVAHSGRTKGVMSCTRVAGCKINTRKCCTY